MRHLEREERKEGWRWGGGGMVGRRNEEISFSISMQYDDKMSTVVSQGYGENYALKTSHTADEIQVEHALWKAMYQNLPVLLIFPFLVHF